MVQQSLLQVGEGWHHQAGGGPGSRYPSWHLARAGRPGWEQPDRDDRPHQPSQHTLRGVADHPAVRLPGQEHQDEGEPLAPAPLALSLPHPSRPLSHLLTDSTALPLRLWSRRPSSCASFGPVQYRISGTHDRCYLMMMMIIIGQPSCDELFPVPRSGLSALIKPSSSSAELPLPRKPRAQQRGGSCET